MNNDLISREALRKAIKNSFKHNLNGYDALLISEIDEFINNAPTVAVNCKDCDGYEAGYSAGLKDAEKTQGEWIEREDMDYIDENKVVHKHFECIECGLIHDFIDGHTSQYNFCPQCGAKMKGGAE